MTPAAAAVTPETAAQEPVAAAATDPATGPFPEVIDTEAPSAEGADHLATAAELADAQRSAVTEVTAAVAEPPRVGRRAARRAEREAAERAAAAAGDPVAGGTVAGGPVAGGPDAAGPEVEAADQTAGVPREALLGWLALVGEVALGLAIGAGLFIGFTVLWKQYVYFALVLAVIVIFAIVTFAYVLRKRDLPTTLLALAVGLIVTIGPLVMLV